MKQAIAILSNRKTTWLLIGLVIASRVLQVLFFYNIRVDGMYQIMAMQNFAEGHGISTSRVLSTDLSSIIYQPLINWPPGYSFLLSPFYLLFGKNYITAGITLEIVAAIALIFICRKILNLLDVPAWLVNLFTFVTGFFIYPFYFINSSDASAITCFTLGIYFALLLLKKGRLSVAGTSLLITSLFFAGFIKYLFIPIAFILPGYLFWKALADKDRLLKKTALISFLSLLVAFSILLTWQKITGGAAVYISQPTRGFFPENLKNTYPAIPASFISPESLSLIFPYESNSHLTLFRLEQTIYILILFSGIFYIIRYIVKKGFKEITPLKSFFFISFILSLGIILLLTCLSLTVGKEENIPGHFWTYVEEPRYYGLIYILVHLGVFLFYRLRNYNKRLIFFSLLLILALIPETIRGIYFFANRVINIKSEEYSWKYEKSIQEFSNRLIQKEKKPGEMVVVSGSSYYFYYRTALYSHVPVMTEAVQLNNLSSIQSKKPCLLVVILREKQLESFKQFLADPKKVFAGSFRGFYFYTVHVTPN